MTNTQIDKVVKIAGTNFDRRRKLSVADVAFIKRAYNKGRSLTSLASKFNVSYGTIKYHTDEEFKRQTNDIRSCYALQPSNTKAQRESRINYKKSLFTK